MQIVINISKKLYDRYKEKDHIKRCDIDEFEKALDSCIILPKGHGNLIDINNIDVIELEESVHFIQHRKGDEVDVYISAPIIIEADKSEE